MEFIVTRREKGLYVEIDANLSNAQIENLVPRLRDLGFVHCLRSPGYSGCTKTMFAIDYHPGQGHGKLLDSTARKILTNAGFTDKQAALVR